MGFKRSSRYHNLGYVNTCALFRTTWAAYLKVCVSICICVHVHRYLYSSELYLSLEIYDCMINTWASSFISCPREVCQGQHETIWESRSSSTFCWLSFNFWSPLRLFLIFFFFFLHSFSSWYMKASGTMPGLPWWLSAKEFTCQCRRHRFDPLARKIPWRKKWQPTLVFLLGKSHGLQSMGLQRVGHNLATQQQQYNAWREACSQ